MKKVNTWFSGTSVYITLAPFLLLYFVIAIVFAPNKYVLDEYRYVQYANNLLVGHFSSPAPNIELWTGRGYPATIAPFLFLKLPLMVLRLLNGCFLYFSLIVFNKCVNIYTSENGLSIYTILLGLYFPVYISLPFIMTECMTWFLISIISWLFIKTLKKENISWKWILITGFMIAFLAMVKVIFGYVILAMIIFSAGMLWNTKFRLSATKSLYIFSFALLLCFPYLIATYSVTGKVFYWSNSSSMSLFTISAPYANDYGDWKSEGDMLKNPNYKAFESSIINLSDSGKDNAYKKKAIENIKAHPLKYFSNCVANLGRMLFDYPYTSTDQSPRNYFYLLPDMFVFVFMMITLGLSAIHYKKLSAEMFFLLVFILIYLGGSMLVSAYCRMFYVTMPFWMLFFCYVFNRVAILEVKKIE
jgi:hypothetical protein